MRQYFPLAYVSIHHSHYPKLYKRRARIGDYGDDGELTYANVNVCNTIDIKESVGVIGDWYMKNVWDDA